MRRSASVRVGILLAVSSLLSCSSDRPPERRCVDGEGRFVDEALCGAGTAAAGTPRDGTASGASGEWDAGTAGPTGPTGPAVTRSGFHFIWIPYGAFGGMGTYAPGYVRRGTGSAGTQVAPGAGTDGSPGSSSVSRGGFGATGAAHAGPATAGS